MRLHTIHTGMIKFDGGAMFGVVPKAIWNRIIPADENNLCSLAMRCLLIEDDDRLILIDNGIGDKQTEKFFGYYHLHGEYSLSGSLKDSGFHPDDITDVFLTHLHFDHCGGGVVWKDRNKKLPALKFKNARYWSNPGHWEWAVHPNPREKASFLTENILPMKESGQLEMIDTERPSPFDQFDILYVDGHTEKQMLPVIKYKGHTLIFAADLLPTTGHIPLPYIMSYDTRPLVSMKEKDDFLKQAVERDYIVFFEHDPVHECCTFRNTEKGVRINEVFRLDEIA